MSPHLMDPTPRQWEPRRWLGGWVLLLLVLQSACVTGGARGRDFRSHSGLASATVYTVDVLEPGQVATRPVAIPPEAFQRTVQRLARDVRRGGRSPREAAHALLTLSGQTAPDAVHMELEGLWVLERYGERNYSFVPLSETGPLRLTPEADEALRVKYVKWCEPRGGGDCLGLLDDGPSLRTDDRRALALALAFGSVLDETRAALAHELLDTRALVAMVVWTVALYCMLWVVPEPTTKAMAAGLTLLLVGWLGLDTVWGLMDGWSRMAEGAHVATTFEELRAAGDDFAKVLGQDAARAMILAVAALSGRTLGEVAARVKSLPGYGLAQVQWEAQGGAAAMGAEAAGAQEAALARAVVAVDTVAAAPGGPLAVVMLKKGGGAAGQGGRGSATVLRHRAGNQQVELANGQRWHLPRGKSATDIPTDDKVGDLLQEAVTRAASEWGPERLSLNERRAIDDALRKSKYWLARLLEREARGRFVEGRVSRQFKNIYDFSSNKGVDVIDSRTGLRYEILSGSESNLALHGRRMAGEFFRMLVF